MEGGDAERGDAEREADREGAGDTFLEGGFFAGILS